MSQPIVRFRNPVCSKDHFQFGSGFSFFCLVQAKLHLNQLHDMQKVIAELNELTMVAFPP